MSRRPVFALALSISFWTILFAYVFNSAIGSYSKKKTAISLPFQSELERIIRVYMPQGWGFFTASPRSHELSIFSMQKLGLKDVYRGPNSNIRNLFGFSRIARSQSAEIGILASNIEPSKWIVCTDLMECQNKSKIVIVENQTSHSQYCGLYLIVKREPLPWAWARMSTSREMSGIIVKSECENV